MATHNPQGTISSSDSSSASSSNPQRFDQPPIPLRPTSISNLDSSQTNNNPIPPSITLNDRHQTDRLSSQSDSDSDDDRYEIPLSSPIRIHHPQLTPRSFKHQTASLDEDDEEGDEEDQLRTRAELERGQLLGAYWKSDSQVEHGQQTVQDLEWDEDDDSSEGEDGHGEEDEEEDDDDQEEQVNAHQSTHKPTSGVISSEQESQNRSPFAHPDPRHPRHQRVISADGTIEEVGRKRRRRRKVYGGGRLDSGGDKSAWEVALGIASDTLSPAPLFIPHAFLLLGLPLGLPVLFLTGILAWFSHVVLVVCGRYVGGRTYAQIASAALPNALKGFNLWFGESVVEIWRLFLAGGRGMVNMMMVSDLFAQLTRQYTPKAGILYSRVFIIVFVALISLIPNFLRPRRPLFLPAAFPTLSRLPLLFTLVWPLAIGIIGFRLRQLNRELGRKLPPTGEGDVYSEIMGGTVWGGFTILLFCLTTPQNTFTHLRSLKRVNKYTGHVKHNMVPLGQPFSSQTSPISDLTMAGPTGTSFFSSYTLRRFSWEAAALFGVLYATLICMAWGLVGYLGMDHGGFEVNFLASLPSHDPWISASRMLLLVVLIPSIPLSLRPANTALFHLMRIPFEMHRASSRRRRLRNRGSGGGKKIEQKEWDDEDEDEPLQGRKVWIARFVTMVVWVGVAIGAITLGGSKGGEGSTIEMLGCVGSTVMTGLMPATFFVVLFHIRKARSIFITTDPSSQLVQDELLLRKESQLQRRLSGRRIWQDIGVFGLLVPFCLVILIKGMISAISETGLDPQQEIVL